MAPCWRRASSSRRRFCRRTRSLSAFSRMFLPVRMCNIVFALHYFVLLILHVDSERRLSQHFFGRRNKTTVRPWPRKPRAVAKSCFREASHGGRSGLEEDPTNVSQVSDRGGR